MCHCYGSPLLSCSVALVRTSMGDSELITDHRRVIPKLFRNLKTTPEPLVGVRSPKWPGHNAHMVAVPFEIVV